MGKGFRLSLAAFLALFLSAPAQAQLPPLYLPAREYAHAFVRAAAARLVSALLGHVPGEFWRAFPFNPQAQSSDGGSGTGDGTSIALALSPKCYSHLKHNSQLVLVLNSLPASLHDGQNVAVDDALS